MTESTEKGISTFAIIVIVIVIIIIIGAISFGAWYVTKTNKEGEYTPGFSPRDSKNSYDSKKTEYVSGRYINLLKKSITPDFISLSELKVYDDKGIELTKSGLTVIMSSIFENNPQLGGESMLDKSDTTIIHNAVELNPFVTLDFGVTKSISKILLVSRKGCCQNQMKGLIVQILDNVKKQVYESSPIKSKSLTSDADENFSAFYEYVIPSKAYVEK